MAAPVWYLNNLGCPTCGQLHARCASHPQNRSDRPCDAAPIKGTWLCATHGGRVLADGGSVAVEMDLDREIEIYATIGPLMRKCSVDTKGRTYVESLEDALNRSNAMVLMLGLLMETLGAKAKATETVVAEGTPRERISWTTQTDGLVGPDADGNLAIHPWAIMYREWTGVQAQLAEVAAKLGLTERQVEVAEAQVSMMAVTLRAILSDLEIDLTAPRTREVLERHLLAMQTSAIEVRGSLTASATAS